MNYTYSRTKQPKKSGSSALSIRKETGVPERTQYRWLDGLTRRSGAERSERSSKLDNDTVQKMIKALEGPYNRRIWTWQHCCDEYELGCSPWTVKRAFNQAGYHECMPVKNHELQALKSVYEL